MAADLRRGAVVSYASPSWGECRGWVLRDDVQVVDGRPSILVQDLHPNGAREWWPVGECGEVPDAH